MYDLIDLRSGCIVYSHCIPAVNPEMNIKLWCLIQLIVISIQKIGADEISGTSCDAYFVAVPFSFGEASHIHHLSLIDSVDGFRYYCPTFTRVYEIGI